MCFGYSPPTDYHVGDIVTALYATRYNAYSAKYKIVSISNNRKSLNLQSLEFKELKKKAIWDRTEGHYTFVVDKDVWMIN